MKLLFYYNATLPKLVSRTPISGLSVRFPFPLMCLPKPRQIKQNQTNRLFSLVFQSGLFESQASQTCTLGLSALWGTCWAELIALGSRRASWEIHLAVLRHQVLLGCSSSKKASLLEVAAEIVVPGQTY